ncbi:hypothetical protein METBISCDRAFT_25710 [Metschnikowia bicuspidata]|uniref:Signal recognition particle subunit SRP72 n=1 Tax=Metschnikowia bicuspidata TaxID=27322 RepID=A0A4P9ZHQ0_9ASCO|nr:hypothetical protein METBISCDRAFT_25710 [Metschnikowia bicuspidata]
MSSSIISSFKSLNVAAAQDYLDHEAIFQASYQYLAKVKEFRDIKAVHNVMVALINSDRYYRALEFLKQVPEDILREFPLEKAYIYYKTGDLTSVEELFASSLDSVEVSDILKTALKHVMAQCYYQSGHMLKALELYQELKNESRVDNELDIACNERAIISQLPSGSHVKVPMMSVSEHEKSYDFIFNEALIELRNNDIEKCLALLKKASSMCHEKNAAFDPADLLAELAPIELALAYVYQVTAHTSEATATLKSLDMDAVTDLMTKHIIKANLVSLTGAPDNVNFTARELNYKDVLHHNRNKMTRSQFRSLVNNHLLLAYQGNTLSKSSSYCTTPLMKLFSEEFGDYTPRIFKLLVRLDIKMADLNTEANWKAISKKIYKLSLLELAKETISDTAVDAALLLVLVNTKSGKFDQSIAVLEQIGHRELASDFSTFHASLFGALVNLYEATKSHKKLATLFSSMIEKFATFTAGDLKNSALYNFVRSVVFRLIGVDSDIDVGLILHTLQTARPDDGCIKTVLGGTSSSTERDLAAQDDVETLLEVDVDQLMAQIPQAHVLSKKGSKKGQSASYKVTKKARKPKFSKTKVVKLGDNFDVNSLDPERWLPMKLRSYYRPPKRDKRKARGHQGALERSPAPSSQSTSTKSKQQKKKKKKGWK